jgi:hypothetical protein
MRPGFHGVAFPLHPGEPGFVHLKAFELPTASSSWWTMWKFPRKPAEKIC